MLAPAKRQRPPRVAGHPAHEQEHTDDDQTKQKELTDDVDEAAITGIIFICLILHAGLIELGHQFWIKLDALPSRVKNDLVCHLGRRACVGFGCCAFGPVHAGHAVAGNDLAANLAPADLQVVEAHARQVEQSLEFTVAQSKSRTGS